jgi:thiosulfate sulfurtransferase
VKGRKMTRMLGSLVLMLAAAAAGAIAGPQIAVDLSTYTFPDTAEGIAVAHTFLLSNVGDRELVIESAVPGCHCTAVALAKSRLQPGESVGLYALLDTEGLSGHTTRGITITSNDPGRWGDHKLNVAFAGNVIERQPYQTSVSDLFYDSHILLDVREPAAYAAGHLVGALNLPSNQAATFAAALPAGAMVVFYDQSGASSVLSAVTQAFHGGGVAAVYALRGGLNLWQQSYGSVRIAAGAATAWQFLDVSGARAYSSSAAVQLYDVTQLLSDYVLIDIRSASAFAAGHIVGAMNLAEGAVSAFIETLPRSAPVFVYSEDGADSDRLVYSLWMRGSRARSLLGGLSEWTKQHENYLIVSSSD